MCRTCEIFLSLTEFHSSGKEGGTRANCKKCVNKTDRRLNTIKKTNVVKTIVNGIIGKDCIECKKWFPTENYHLTGDTLISGEKARVGRCRICQNIEKDKYRKCKHGKQHCVECELSVCLGGHGKRPDRCKICDPEAYKKYRKAHMARQIKKRKEDPKIRLRHNLETRMRIAIKQGDGENVSINFEELVGCTIDNLWDYLEGFFDDVNVQDNYCVDWVIDHIKPCALFDMSDPQQQRDCFHWSNLQPLTCVENSSKGAKYEAI
jgi:hypothetical protein